MNGYDFDKTIYDGDSTIDFYIYSLKRNITLIRYLPIQVYGFILYTLKLKRKEYFKEKFFSFLKGINNIDNYVTSFWNKNGNKIKKWYLEQKKDDDIIISASPDFLLKEIINRLGINYLIATIVDEKKGKFLSKNSGCICHLTNLDTFCLKSSSSVNESKISIAISLPSVS